MILFITRKWPPAMGGMETYSFKLTEALRRRSEVSIAALPGRPDGSPPSIAALLAFACRTAAGLVTTRRPRGIVHVADMASWPLAFVARLRSGRWRTVLSAHGSDVSYPLRGNLRGTIYRLYLRCGARCLPRTVVIANSTATADCVRSYGFGRVSVSPLATDMRPAVALGRPEDFILFAGRLVESKGCGWFIRKVLPRLPDGITLKVAGTVWSASEGAALDHPRVDHLGVKAPDELARLYARAICVVVPNLDRVGGGFEGFGLVAAEAAACGGVPLASAHSGLRDAVIDGVTGFHLPPGDADAWIGKITEVSNWAPSARAAFLQRSIETAKSRFSWERVAADTVEAYAACEAR